MRRSDRHLGRASARRAGVDEAARLPESFDTRYRDFNARHFHEKLVAKHGVQRSYNWVRLTLQVHGRVRRALPSMAPGRLALDARLAAGVHPRRCHVRGLLLRRRGGRQLPGPPQGGARAVRSTPGIATSTPRRPAARWARTTRPRSDASCANSAASPPTRPRRGGSASTLRKRLPQELRLAADIDEANRFLERVYLPGRNARFATPPEGVGLRALRRRPGRHPLRGAHRLQ